MTYCPLIDDECRDDCEWAVDHRYGPGKGCALRQIAERLRGLDEIIREL